MLSDRERKYFVTNISKRHLNFQKSKASKVILLSAAMMFECWLKFLNFHTDQESICSKKDLNVVRRYSRVIYLSFIHYTYVFPIQVWSPSEVYLTIICKTCMNPLNTLCHINIPILRVRKISLKNTIHLFYFLNSKP